MKIFILFLLTNVTFLATQKSEPSQGSQDQKLIPDNKTPKMIKKTPLQIKQEPKVLKPCSFDNILFTLGDSFHKSQKVGDSQLKLTFNSPSPCLIKPTLILTAQSKEYRFPFKLIDIYIAKIFPDSEQEKSRYYVKYVYLAEIVNIGTPSEFDYAILRNPSDKKSVEKPKKFDSEILTADASKKYKFIIFGDNTFNDVGKFLFSQVELQKMDLLIILGDLAYELHHKYGKNGDEYFKMLEKVGSRVPIQFINGNHDMQDLGNLLNYRVRQPGCRTKEHNNFYTFQIANSIFYFYNTDFYSRFAGNEIFKRMEQIAKSHNSYKNTLKFLFTHRSLNCFNNKTSEGCFEYNSKFYKQYQEYFEGLKFDVHFSAHIHLYERFSAGKMREIMKKGVNKQGLYIGEENLLIGTAGQKEDIPFFVDKALKEVEGLKYLPDQLGYLEVRVEDLEVKGNFVSVKKLWENQGKSEILDQFIYKKEKDRKCVIF